MGYAVRIYMGPSPVLVAALWPLYGRLIRSPQ